VTQFEQFEAYRRERDGEEVEPFGFVISGDRRVTPAKDGDEPTFEPFAEAFECLPLAPIGMLEQFSRGGLGYMGLIEGVIVPERRARFVEICESPEYLVGADLVKAIANRVSEVYVGRPTKRPAGSPSGPSSSGATSPAQSGSEG